jgi:hypothetical protein
MSASRAGADWYMPCSDLVVRLLVFRQWKIGRCYLDEGARVARGLFGYGGKFPCDFEKCLSGCEPLMPRSRHARWLLVPLALLWCQLPDVHAQSGPSVQIFTSTLPGGGTRLLPIERLPFATTFSLSAGYDTNVDTNPGNNQGGSFYSTAGVHLAYSFGTERTRASLSTGASATYYDNPGRNSFDFNPDLSLNLGLSHAVSERMSLNGSVYVRYGSEPDFSTDLGQNRKVGNYFETADSISALYQWLERFSTVTKYSFAKIQYGDKSQSALLDLFAQNQDRVEQSIDQQFRFLFLPFTTLTADYFFSSVMYDFPNRDSTSHFLTAGIEQTLGPHLQGSFHAGAQFRHSNLTQSDTINPTFDGALFYTVSEKTSVNFTARYLTEEPDVLRAASQTTFRTGLNVTYALTARISSSLSLYYIQSDDNNRTDFPIFLQLPSASEDTIDVALDLTYAVNPRLSITAGYHFTDVSSDDPLRTYSRSSFSGGLSYSF